MLLYITCILLSINCMCIAGSTKSCIIQANSVAHWKPILWRTRFCGAPKHKCATETLILWRMGRCATETLFLWRSFCGAPPMRHRIHFWCATDEAFPTSDDIILQKTFRMHVNRTQGKHSCDLSSCMVWYDVFAYLPWALWPRQLTNMRDRPLIFFKNIWLKESNFKLIKPSAR
jgi:hypothetical protein